MLEAHLLQLNDARFFDSIVDRIGDGLPSERAAEEVFSAAVERLVLSGDPCLKARVEEKRYLCQSLRHAMVVGDCRSHRGHLRQEPLIFVTPCPYVPGTYQLIPAHASHGPYTSRNSAVILII